LKLIASQSCVADYEWHQVTQVPVEQTPKKAIDAFLHVFVEVNNVCAVHNSQGDNHACAVESSAGQAVLPVV
jgi:hypothetical protein